MCLFPASFKWSLLSFLHVVHTGLSKECILSLLDCLRQEDDVAPWTAALIGQLHRDIRDPQREILTPQCRQSVRELSDQFKGTGRSGGWSSYFAKPEICPTEIVPSSQSQKRKSENLDVDSDPSNEGQQSKRMKMELPNSADGGVPEEVAGETEGSPADEKSPPQDQTPVDDAEASLLPPPDSNSVTLPDHIKVRAARSALKTRHH